MNGFFIEELALHPTSTVCSDPSALQSMWPHPLSSALLAQGKAKIHRHNRTRNVYTAGAESLEDSMEDNNG